CLILSSITEDNRCASSNAVSCTKCLALGPECGWCAQEDFISGGSKNERCDIVSNLIHKGCSIDLIEHPSVHVKPSENEINTQVTPGEVLIQLHQGAEANFMLKIHPLKKYPVDLYYLVDVSASMHNNIEKLNSVGNDLSRKMAFFSRDFRLGFGSYVDKTVSPYISIHPERIHNQCSDYNLDCMPPHGYIHVLSLTENITEFEKAVHRQKISGNIDTPEGGFDAMLQAAVCEEHPSLGQLSEKLIDNNINVIFAVQGKQFHWYKDLLPLLPGTIAGEIESKAANLNNLVVDAYQKLISEVKVQVENQVKGIYFNITAICPDGTRKPGTDGCGNVTSNDEVLFNVTVTMEKCDVTGGKSYAIIKPIGFNETTKIHIHRNCSCQCDDGRGPKRKCVEETFLDAKCFQCDENKCHIDEDTFPSESCKSHKDQPVCSGRGVCICGRCLCHKIKFGKVYGKYCEKDDFSCPYHHGNLCAECFSSPSYLRIFFIIFIVTFLIGLLKVLIIRQVILQWNSNKIKSSADYRVSASKKDKLILQSVCTRAVTYRREKPEEIKMDISKLNAHETFRCNF
ncbi:hypothetical protein G4228_012059, partial [Cervus hanglu yarkandensis]